MSAEARRRTGSIDAAAFHVAGVTLSALQTRFVWQAWHFQDLHTVDVRGSSATNGSD